MKDLSLKVEQHEKISRLHADSSDGWVCGNAYRDAYIFSPHKRRGEMSKSHKEFKECHGHFGIDHFEDRKCQHDSRGVRDYRIVRAEKEQKVTISGVQVDVWKKKPCNLKETMIRLV